MSGRHPHPYRDVPLLLVSGIGRSGTTVLRECLGAHPAMHTTGCENNVVYDVINAARVNKTMPSRRVALRVDERRYDELFLDLLLNLLWPEPLADAPESLLAYSGMTPESAEMLLDIWPRARVVYIVRHGVEVVASRMLYSSFADQPFDEHCARWASAARFAAWARSRDDVLVVRHENLLSESGARALLHRIWSFAGLAWAEEPMRVLRTMRHPTKHPDEGDGEADLARRRERWRLWTDEQRRTFLRICGSAMRDLNYTLPAPGGSEAPATDTLALEGASAPGIEQLL